MTNEADGAHGVDLPATSARPADRAKIEQLKRAIERGEYSIEEKLIAEKIIAHGALSDLN